MPHWLALMIESLPSLLWAGLVFTVPLTLLSFALGLGVGFVAALTRLFAPAPFSALVKFYVWVIRGTPLLVQLFLIFYGLPSIGIVLDAFPAALIGFTLNVGAYTSEIIRAVIVAGAQGAMGGGLFDRHDLAAGHAPDHPAAGQPHRGAAALQFLHFADQGYLACRGGHRAGAVPGGAADRGDQL